MAIEVKNEPHITVGIMDRQSCVEGRVNGTFSVDGIGPRTNRLTDGFSANAAPGGIVLCDAAGRVVGRSPHLRIGSGGRTTFDLFRVTIGSRFHWERSENQTFRGNLILRARQDGTMAVINEVPLEDYLESVISSEMNASAPGEMLKSHAILSRSWLLAALRRKRSLKRRRVRPRVSPGRKERWCGGMGGRSMIFSMCAPTTTASGTMA